MDAASIVVGAAAAVAGMLLVDYWLYTDGGVLRVTT